MAAADLEAQIARDPDDPAPRLVYADWCLEHGDPRGELISLQSRGLVAEAEAWLTRHADQLCGPFAANLRQRAWWLGFLESCTLVLDAPEVLARFLAHPSARAVRRLAIKTPDPRAAIEILGHHDLSALQHLAIRASSPVAFGAIEPLSRAAPDLRSLVLRDLSGTAFDLAGISLPSLRSLALATTGDLADSIEPLCEARWPVLANLRLRTVSAPVPAWGTLFGAVPFPALRDLAFAPGGPGFAPLVANTPLLARLEVLRYATPDPEVDLRIFVVRRSRFAHLRRLGLPNLTTLGRVQRLDLLRLCRDVRFH